MHSCKLVVFRFTELNHQQSREIQQHHARTANNNNRHYLHVPLLRRIVQQSYQETARLVTIVSDAASQAWKDHSARQELQTHNKRQHQHHPINPQHQHHAYLDEFGIPQTDDYTPPFLNNTQRQQYATTTTVDHDYLLVPPHFNSNQNDSWGAVANLDTFFTCLYNYYYHRGLASIVGRGVVDLTSLLFTLYLSVVLFAYVDWAALATCHDERTCHADLQIYLIHKPFARTQLWTVLIILYCALFSAYGLFAAWSFQQTLRQARHAKWVFEERLGISARKLQGGAVDWERDVVNKLLEVQRSGEYRVAIHGQELDALVVANRILRKENFMVAMFNRGLFDLSVPWIGKYFGHTFFCSSLEVSKMS
jgi:autophagy-related protein 9